MRELLRLVFTILIIAAGVAASYQSVKAAVSPLTQCIDKITVTLSR